MKDASENQDMLSNESLVARVLRETITEISSDPRFDPPTIHRLWSLLQAGRFTASRIKDALRPQAGEPR